MPLYDHYCPECGKTTEHVCKIDERKQFVPCSHCGGSAERVCGAAIKRVEPVWLESSLQGLHSQDRHLITDRNSFDKYLKREGIAQVG